MLNLQTSSVATVTVTLERTSETRAPSVGRVSHIILTHHRVPLLAEGFAFKRVVSLTTASEPLSKDRQQSVVELATLQFQCTGTKSDSICVLLGLSY
ncbi:hypothetical protein VZT92_003546 [Zoarces viviparus]|uniref:Uncharacterized protein n=1 Tax=Zoarces viviparus TaxID=48416 RepID=A0AAW1FUH4_ZOAVI